MKSFFCFPVGSTGVFYFLSPCFGFLHSGRFPEEVGFSSVTRLLQSQSITPVEGCGGQWGSEPLNPVLPLQPDAELCASAASVSPLCSAIIGGGQGRLGGVQP